MPGSEESPPTPPPHRAALSPLLAAAYFGNVEDLMDGLSVCENLQQELKYLQWAREYGKALDVPNVIGALNHKQKLPGLICTYRYPLAHWQCVTVC
eukprot:s3934_g3.t1